MATEGKAALRKRLLADRRAVPANIRAAQDCALVDQAQALANPGETVCAYVPVGTEPGSAALVDALSARAGRVLLPVATTDDDGHAEPLRWGQYRPGRLVSARFGLLEPPEPWLPATTIAEAQVVIVPALAVDRTGARLGRGRGFYDRTLALCSPRARLIAVVRDEELLDLLPADAHDVPVTHALTPGRGLIELAV